MMILKTNQLRNLALALILMSAGRASALEAFECVRDLMPITSQAAFQGHRKDVEKPFMLTDKFMVFPEVKKSAVTGFYIYSASNAWYYDSVTIKEGEKKRPLADLKRTGEFSLYSLVAQPEGLETIVLQFMPAFITHETNGGGPVMIGSTVMPVIGAFISRPNEQLTATYRNPGEVDDATLKKWVNEHSTRRPALAGTMEIDRQLLHLATGHAKSKSELWAPIFSEIKVRRQWVQSHNLDEKSFKQLSLLMESSCK
jgi:hypothetical protein